MQPYKAAQNRAADGRVHLLQVGLGRGQDDDWAGHRRRISPRFFLKCIELVHGHSGLSDKFPEQSAAQLRMVRDGKRPGISGMGEHPMGPALPNQRPSGALELAHRVSPVDQAKPLAH
jgi:hypothetical protein